MRCVCQTTIRTFAAVLLSAVALSGCGFHTGYAPATAPVHRGSGGSHLRGVPDSLTVVSWNIQFGENIEQAITEMAAFPRLATADLLLLQEMDPAGSARVAEALGFGYVHASAAVHHHHHKLFGNAVLSRWPIVDDQVLVLPHKTALTGHQRLAVAADIDLGGGRILRAVSVHTATVIMPHDKRLAQAMAASDSLLGQRPLTLLGGDFNTVSDYEVVQLRQVMRRVGLDEARLPAGPTIANRLKKLPGSTPVLDHLYYRGMRPVATGVVRDAAASDHYPVWAVFYLPRAR